MPVLSFLIAVFLVQTPAIAPVGLQAKSPNIQLTLQNNSAELVADPYVKNQLQISPKQWKGILAATAAGEQRLSHIDGSDAAALLIERETNEAVLRQLSADQGLRLSQLAAQAFGVEVLRLKDVQAKLALSPEHIASINSGLATFDALNDDVSNALAADLVKLPEPTTQDPAAIEAFVKEQAKIFEKHKPEHIKVLERRRALTKELLDGLSGTERKILATILGEVVTVQSEG